MAEIVNKVAQSKLITLDLEQYLPKESDFQTVDIVDGLDQGIILREKPFREWIKNYAWDTSKPFCNIICSEDAIVAKWAYMLVASQALSNDIQPFFGHVDHAREEKLLDALKNEDLSPFKGAPLVVKGCGQFELSPRVYTEVVHLLQPIAKTLMFGEPCSTVPIYKAQKKPTQ